MRSLCFAVVATLVASSVSGQVLQGTFVDPKGEPVIAALVTLSDSNGAPVAEALSDSNGVYVVEAREPGVHTLRIERIGFAPRHGGVMLQTGATGLSDTLRMMPVVRGDIAAGAVTACHDERVSTIWAEARKTLRVIALAEELGLVGVNGVRYMREMDGTSWAQLGVLSQEAFAGSGVPVREPPPEASPGHWFAIVDTTQALYFAASARSLAAADFESDHCFTAITTNAKDSTRLGLQFEPRTGITSVGIAGTMWLDRETLRLRSVDYSYQAGSGATAVIASGIIEFNIPDNAMPHVSRWRLRLPVTRIVRGAGGNRTEEVRTIVEDGALVFGNGRTPMSDPDDVFPALRGAYALDPIVVEAEARTRRRQIVSTPGTGPETVLSDWEIQYTVPTNAYELIRALHPRWLKTCMGASDTGTAIRVDGIKLTSDEAHYVEVLQDIPVPEIEAVQWVNPVEAPMLFGMGHTCGAILIRLKRFPGT